MSVIEPSEGSANGDGKGDTSTDTVIHKKPEEFFQADGDGISVHDWSLESCNGELEHTSKRTSTPGNSILSTDLSPRRYSIASGTYVPRGAPSDVATGSPPSRRRCGPLDTYRLSMPPAIKLPAPVPSLRPLPLPRKHDDCLSLTAYRPHPAYPVEEWTMRTPSPVRSFRDGISTPPLEGRKGLGITGAGLMGVISSTWRRSVSGAQAERKSDVDGGPRSVSY